MLNPMIILDGVVDEFENDGWFQKEPWELEDEIFTTNLEDEDGNKLPISVEIEVTDKDMEEIAEEVATNIEIGEIEDGIQKSVTKSFEDEGYKQNNYWEYDYESDTYWATFIDFNLNGVSVSVFGLTEEDIKNGNW